MNKIEFFDYKSLARKMRVPSSKIKQIEKEVKEEFPSDKMLYELHVLRALKSRYWQKEAKQLPLAQ